MDLCKHPLQKGLRDLATMTKNSAVPLGEPTPRMSGKSPPICRLRRGARGWCKASGCRLSKQVCSLCSDPATLAKTGFDTSTLAGSSKTDGPEILVQGMQAKQALGLLLHLLSHRVCSMSWHTDSWLGRLCSVLASLRFASSAPQHWLATGGLTAGVRPWVPPFCS